MVLVMVHILSTAMKEHRNNDRTIGEALKIGMQGMTKFIIMIIIAAVIIPVMWEFLFP
jgi:hypothetical protein